MNQYKHKQITILAGVVTYFRRSELSVTSNVYKRATVPLLVLPPAADRRHRRFVHSQMEENIKSYIL